MQRYKRCLVCKTKGCEQRALQMLRRGVGGIPL